MCIDNRERGALVNLKWYYKKIIPFTAGAIFISAFILFTDDAPGNNFTYVGVNVCRECHGEDAIGNQYAIWVSSPHAKAFFSLLTDRGMVIAKKEGIDDPVNHPDCLRCHTTGRGRYEELKSEGVGCEACHGPGSEYHKASNHVDYTNRENGYRKALRLGMYPIRGIDSLKRRERLCTSCHRDDRPCYPESHDEIHKQKIYIHTIDSLIKGNVNFKHRLRR